MSGTFQEADDSILSIAKTILDNLSILTVWEGVSGNTVPATQENWCRVTTRHVGGRQTTVGGSESTNRFERTGFVVVQIFCPIGKGKGEGLSVAKSLSDGYEGKSSSVGVWFSNVRINEIGVDGDFYQINFIADFKYDEIK